MVRGGWSAHWTPMLASMRERLAGPLVVHVVANSVHGDSRVLKSAQTSQGSGLPSMILGFTTEETAETFELEGVPVFLAPLPAADPLGPVREFDERWPQIARAIASRRAARSLRSRQLDLVSDGPGTVRSVLRAPRWSEHVQPPARVTATFLAALAPLRARMIHVHDTVPLPAAVGHAASARVRGRQVRVMYDSHECVSLQQKEFPDEAKHRARLAIEEEFIGDANDVITVSDAIAILLASRYGLAQVPGVVTNAPSAARDPQAPSLRDVVGLEDGVPLIVYSGSINPERGLDTAVRALRRLPDAHLAVVAATENRHARALTRLATRVGVADRVHFAPYVRPGEITQYLSSADVGIIPRKQGSHLDLSLPTKFREYLHAGLPLVVSANAEMRRTVRATGVGLAFPCGDPQAMAGRLRRVLNNPKAFTDAITPTLLSAHSWEAQSKTLARYYESVRTGAEHPAVHGASPRRSGAADAAPESSV